MIRNAVWASNRYWRFFESYERCGIPKIAKRWRAVATVVLLIAPIFAVFTQSALLLFLSGILVASSSGIAWGLAKRHRNAVICERARNICGVPCNTLAQAKRAMLQRYRRRYRIDKVRDTIKYVEESVEKCMERREFDQANHLFFQVMSLRWLSKLGTSPWWLITAIAGTTFYAADKAFELSTQWVMMTKKQPLLLAMLPLFIVLMLIFVGQMVAGAGVLYTKLCERRGLSANRYSRQRLHYLLGDVVYFLV